MKLIDSEKGLFEPDVVKATRPVLREFRGEILCSYLTTMGCTIFFN